MHGFGTFTGVDGTKYEGPYKDGLRHGEDGTLTNAKLKYQGSFILNKFHCEGVLTNEQGTYEGNFEQGHKQGSGTMFYLNGSVFRGNWQYNMFVEGEMTLDDGTRLDGVWRHANSGAGTITFPSGDLY